MISMAENEVLGLAMPAILEKYGEEKTQKFVDELMRIDSTADLKGEFEEMATYGITNTDYTTGKAKKKVAKTYKEVQSFFESGKAAPIKTAKSYSDIAKLNIWHDAKGRFTTAANAATVSGKLNTPWYNQRSSWGDNLEMGKDGKLRYNAERRKLHDQIINKALEGVEKPAPGEQELVMMGGGGGSGKSYVINSGFIDVAPKEEKKAVFIDPDSIKDMLPEYVQMKNSKDENEVKNAANFVQQESSHIAEKIFATAIAQGHNVVYDGTASDTKQLNEFTTQARRVGAKAKAVYVATPFDVAQESAKSRYEKEKRYVPDKVLKNAHKKVSENFEGIAKSNMFDEVQLVQNDRKNPLKVIAQSKGGKLDIYDQAEYDNFIAKKDL